MIQIGFRIKMRKVKLHSSVSYDDSNRMTVYAVYQGAQKLKWMYTTTYDKIRKSHRGRCLQEESAGNKLENN